MADGGECDFSLMSLEDELTCSICLSTFDCPVTIPCGHNFCQDCLLATWKDSYTCPQCRTVFATKPELKKNTVLSTVVQTFNLRSNKSPAAGPLVEETQPREKDVIRCDNCMEAEAAQTCLTCMASFCEQHLRPHRDNPIFRVHQLSPPIGDLMERICSDHHKLMEHFCTQHDRMICSQCLQQVHKGCSFTSPEAHRATKETDLKSKMGMLDGKIAKNTNIISQMTDVQDKLKSSAAIRKKALAAEYQQMRDMLAREEHDALTAVDREVVTGDTKLRGLIKKFTENITNMTKAKDDIRNLLSCSQTAAFLQTSFNVPQAATFEPYCPRVSLDSKKVLATEAFAAELKKTLAEYFEQPVEARLPLHKPPTPTYTPTYNPGQMAGFNPHFIPLIPKINEQAPIKLPRSHSPGPAQKAVQKKKPQKTKKAPEDSLGNKSLAKSMESLLEFGDKDKPRGRPPKTEGKETTETSEMTKDISSAEKRSELMKFGTVLTFDPRTAHKRIALTEDFTKASVSDEHTNYADCHQRFSVCSQVLGSKGFSRGRHYWEVRMSSNNFMGIGLAYNSIDRKGPSSRLGRNALSWCVEWFNVKLSAWHNSTETVLNNPDPKRVGVLLDCEEGKVTFFNVADRAYPFYSFPFSFVEAVYPAFWIFSSGSYVSLCKLQ
ncbi:E3 ubiquitin/ISG15 ligase TRIM25-like isoform X2 [Cololabis saira]|uniref:E3 ubiquitin/ISG15 ligase TRIM25-like isoform X2 n=1 Tax=Cololabis saira TaxID=129043 RepID=UPI002AD25583|nr:E3 ubiquitin/ISG15 ligase TRIM25-like isoform X2 [Cololabis saira]